MTMSKKEKTHLWVGIASLILGIGQGLSVYGYHQTWTQNISPFLLGVIGLTILVTMTN